MRESFEFFLKVKDQASNALGRFTGKVDSAYAQNEEMNKSLQRTYGKKASSDISRINREIRSSSKKSAEAHKKDFLSKKEQRNLMKEIGNLNRKMAAEDLVETKQKFVKAQKSIKQQLSEYNLLEKKFKLAQKDKKFSDKQHRAFIRALREKRRGIKDATREIEDMNEKIKDGARDNIEEIGKMTEKLDDLVQVAAMSGMMHSRDLTDANELLGMSSTRIAYEINKSWGLSKEAIRAFRTEVLDSTTDVVKWGVVSSSEAMNAANAFVEAGVRPTKQGKALIKEMAAYTALWGDQGGSMESFAKRSFFLNDRLKVSTERLQQMADLQKVIANQSSMNLAEVDEAISSDTFNTAMRMTGLTGDKAAKAIEEVTLGMGAMQSSFIDANQFMETFLEGITDRSSESYQALLKGGMNPEMLLAQWKSGNIQGVMNSAFQDITSMLKNVEFEDVGFLAEALGWDKKTFAEFKSGRKSLLNEYARVRQVMADNAGMKKLQEDAMNSMTIMDRLGKSISNLAGAELPGLGFSLADVGSVIEDNGFTLYFGWKIFSRSFPKQTAKILGGFKNIGAKTGNLAKRIVGLGKSTKTMAAAEKVANVATKARVGLLGRLSNALQGTGKLAGKIRLGKLGGILPKFGSGISKMTGIFTKVGGGFSKLVGSAPKLAGLFSKLGKFAPLLAKVSVYLGMFTGFVKGVKDQLGKGGDWVQGILGGLKGMGQELFVGFADMIAGGLDWVISKITGKTTDFFKGSMTIIKDYWGKVFNKIGGKLGIWLHQAVQWFKGVFSKIGSAVKNWWRDMIQGAKDLIHNMIEGIKTRVSNWWKDVVQGYKDIVAKIKGLFDLDFWPFNRDKKKEKDQPIAKVAKEAMQSPTQKVIQDVQKVFPHSQVAGDIRSPQVMPNAIIPKGEESIPIATGEVIKKEQLRPQQVVTDNSVVNNETLEKGTDLNLDMLTVLKMIHSQLMHGNSKNLGREFASYQSLDLSRS